MYWNTWSQWEELFGKKLEGIALGMGFEVLKAHAISSWLSLPSSSVSQDVSTQLLPVCCHAPFCGGHGLNPLKL